VLGSTALGSYWYFSFAGHVAQHDGTQITATFTSFSLRALGFNASSHPVTLNHHKAALPRSYRRLLAGRAHWPTVQNHRPAIGHLARRLNPATRQRRPYNAGAKTGVVWVLLARQARDRQRSVGVAAIPEFLERHQIPEPPFEIRRLPPQNAWLIRQTRVRSECPRLEARASLHNSSAVGVRRFSVQPTRASRSDRGEHGGPARAVGGPGPPLFVIEGRAVVREYAGGTLLVPLRSERPDARPGKGIPMIPDDHSPEAVRTRWDLGGTSTQGDRMASDHDQTGSDRDQDAADRDQAASDQDQAASDHDLARGLGSAGYDSSRTTRDQTTLARRGTSRERRHTALSRDMVAGERDLAAALRDQAAEAPDHQADAMDAQIDRSTAGLESLQATSKAQIKLQGARDRERAANDPPRSPSQRREAARDRAEAARDWLSAAQDRAHAATEGDAAHESTEAERRGPGMAAVQREIDRARRRDGLLVVAYVDLEGLQLPNEIDDQDVGDDRVKRLVGVMKAHLGSDELIVRLGGDEFLCALPGTTIESVGGRVEELAAQLTGSPDASPVNMGLAELVVDDHAFDLVKRAHAHADLLAVRREDRCEQRQRNE
jgi:GGDEF domain-containing protein